MADITKRLICVLLPVLSLAGCASVAPPSGGPEDKTPPEILFTSPPTGTTNVPSKVTVEIQFSKKIDEASFTEALFITPPLPESPKVRWRGSRALATLNMPPPDVAVALTIGSGVKDLRGNSMTESYSFAFTRGDSLPKGRIEGMVVSAEMLRTVLVGAWPIEDSVYAHPADTLPLYVTMAGAEGNYALEFIREGRYRLLCWEDRNRDRRWDPSIDRLGVAWEDVSALGADPVWMSFIPSKRDTAQTRLLMVSSVNRRQVLLRYSRQPNLNPAELPIQATLLDTAGNPLKVISAWWSIPDTNRLVLFTEHQSPRGRYRLLVPADTSWWDLTGADQLDTLGPRVSAFRPASGARDIALNAEGWIAFTEGVQITPSDTLLQLVLSDSIKVPVKTRQREPNLIVWRADTLLPPAGSCRLKLNMSGISDLSGNPSPDSLWVSGFSIVNPAEVGQISGVIRPNPTSPAVAVARPLMRGARQEVTTPVKADGSFNISPLQPGKYLLWAFEDLNSDGVHFGGSLKPWQPAERFALSPDTIEVRPRWESGGHIILFR